MKKALLSLLFAVMCLPFAFGQNYAGRTFITLDTVACDSFHWTVTDSTYTQDATEIIPTDDTVFVLTLTVRNTIYDTLVPVEGSGECSYRDTHDRVWLEAGTFYDTLTAVSTGCDSIIKLNITLNGTSFDTIAKTVCGTYEYRDSIYSESTSFEDTVVTGGCSRYTHVNLTINPTYDNPLQQVEAGCNYKWKWQTHDSIITDTDIHIDTLRTVKGCDSIVSLQVIAFTQYDSMATSKVTACNNYKWHDVTYDTDNLYYFDTVVKPSGSVRYYNDSCNRVYSLNLTVKKTMHDTTTVKTCDSYHWDINDEYYYASKSNLIVRKKFSTLSSCDSIVYHLNLTIRKSPTVSIEGKQNITPGHSATLKAVCSESNVKYKWHLNNDTNTVVSTDSIYTTPILEGNTDVHLAATGSNKCVAHKWITIAVNNGIDDVAAANINLYPNPASRFLNIEAKQAIRTVTVFNTLGQQSMSLEGNGTQMQLDLGNLATGQYTLVIATEDGQFSTHKFIISK